MLMWQLRRVVRRHRDRNIDDCLGCYRTLDVTVPVLHRFALLCCVQGKTALDWATEGGHQAVVEVIQTWTAANDADASKGDVILKDTAVR